MTKRENDAMNDAIRDTVKRRRKTVNWFEDDETDRPRRERRPMPIPRRGKEAEDDRATHRPSSRE